MKSKIILLAVPLAFIMTLGFSQEKSKKELKEEQNLANEKQAEGLVNSREFRFEASYAIPDGSGQISLASNANWVKFNPDLVDAYLPYFGRGYSGVGFSGESGIKVQGKPEEFSIVKNKKDFQIDVKVKGDDDLYRLSLSVGFDGTAMLTVMSNYRSPITYQGAIYVTGKIK